MRGIEAFLNAVPRCVVGGDAVADCGWRGSRRLGSIGDHGSTSQLRVACILTPNTETTYGTTFLDLKAWGPTVIEAPPQSLCVVDDFWFRYVADMGIAGPDRGAGGKYLFLPPGYDGDHPRRGVLRLPLPDVHELGGPTGARWGSGDEADQDLPARRGCERRRTTCSSTSPTRSSTPCIRNDFSFFEEVAEILAGGADRGPRPGTGRPARGDRPRRRAAVRSPTSGCGPSSSRRRGDRRRHRPHRRLRSRATRTPCSTARGRTRSSAAATSSCATAHACSMPAPSSTTWPPWSPPPWRTPRSAPDRPTPTRSTTATATSSTAAAPTGCMSTRTCRRRTSGPSTSTTPRRGHCSRCRRRSGPPSPATPGPLQANDDGSHDLYFGPVAPEGKETNWVETVPGKSWFQLFRIYGPLQPWFDQTWRLNEFEPITHSFR